MDKFSRKIIGWSISKLRNADFTTSSLSMAIRKRTPLVDAIFHTDQGIEYAGDRFQAALKDAQLKASMSGKDRCLDNTTMESFFHTFKTESFYQRKFDDLEHIKKEFMSYIYFYNNERLHSSLGYVSPNEYEQRVA
jgi:transposase InsO family protein